MLKALASFAALSMAGTVVLSLLSDGGLRRTASMVIGLLMLMCWAEDIFALFGHVLPAGTLGTALSPTAVTLNGTQQEAAAALSARWEAAP